MENKKSSKFYSQDLNLFYGENHALKNVSLDIEERQITALIGPSGCGKSTFLKTLNRMNDLVPNVKITGKVVLDGEDIYAKGVDVTLLRKKVGMVFQSPNPFPMSIYDNIAYGPRLHGVKRRMQLDEIVEKSLRGAAIWDEVKDRLKKMPWVFLAASSSVFALPVPWPWNRKSFSWTNLPAPWIPFPPQRLRNSAASSSRITPLSSLPTICSRPPVFQIKQRFSFWARSWRPGRRNRFSLCPRTNAQKNTLRGGLANESQIRRTAQRAPCGADQNG